jgi:hypothetical protein
MVPVAIGLIERSCLAGERQQRRYYDECQAV